MARIEVQPSSRFSILSANYFTVSNLLTESRTGFTTEAREVLKAGLASTPYQHLDDTTTRVDGDGLGWHYETSRDIFEEMVSVIPYS